MIKNSLYLLAIIAFCFATSQQAKAAHIIAADFEWEKPHPDSVRIDLLLYEDCPFNSSPSQTQSINITGKDKCFSNNIELSLSTSKVVAQGSDCAQQGYDIKQMIYSVTLAIADLYDKGCCEFSLGFSCQFNSFELNNLADYDGFYTETYINACEGGLEAENKHHALPVFFAYNDVSYHLGAKSKNNWYQDSIKWSSVLDADQKTKLYNLGYAIDMPLKFNGFYTDQKNAALPLGLHLDPNTGLLKFRTYYTGNYRFAIEESRYQNQKLLYKRKRELLCKSTSYYEPSMISDLSGQFNAFTKNTHQVKNMVFCKTDTIRGSIISKGGWDVFPSPNSEAPLVVIDASDGIIYSKDANNPTQINYKIPYDALEKMPQKLVLQTLDESAYFPKYYFEEFSFNASNIDPKTNSSLLLKKDSCGAVLLSIDDIRAEDSLFFNSASGQLRLSGIDGKKELINYFAKDELFETQILIKRMEGCFELLSNSIITKGNPINSYSKNKSKEGIICPNEPIELNVHLKANQTITWDNNGSKTIQTKNDTIVNFQISLGNCTVNDTFIIKTDKIDLDFVSNATTPLAIPAEVQFNANNESQLVSTYQWYPEGINGQVWSTIDSEYKYEYKQTGEFTPALVVTYGSFKCKDSFYLSQKIQLYNSVQDVNKSKLSAYPNPANEQIYITNYDVSNNYKLEYQISNTNGQVLLTGKVATNGIPTSALANGAYILTVFSNKGETWTHQLIIKR